ncbi:MAG: hypothetical protein ACRC3J_05430 [Culicoidibacterales bacterium]
MIIGISGKKRSGKDTVALMLKDELENVNLIAFASPIKDCLLAALNTAYGATLTKQHRIFTMDDMNGIGYDRETIFDGDYTETDVYHLLLVALNHANNRHHFDDSIVNNLMLLCAIYSQVEHLSIRRLMQIIGTDIVVQAQTNYWVDSALSRIKPDMHNIFTDVRQLHEMDALRNLNAKIVFVTRLNTHIDDTHITEIGLQPIDSDVIIENNETLEHLHNKVKGIL